MEQNPQQPPEIAVSHIPNHSASPVKPFLVGILLMFIISVIAVGSFMAGARSVDESEPLPAQESTQPTSESQTESLEATNEQTANWQTYTLTQVALSLKLPPSLAKYDWTEHLIPGEKGNNFCFEAEEKSAFIKKAYAGGIGVCPSKVSDAPFVIGGTSVDFEAGRGGQFTDLQGFTKNNTTYMAKFVSAKTFEIPSEYVTPIENGNGVEIIKIVGKNATSGEWRGPITGTPGDGYIGALINTKNPTHPGLAVQLQLGKGITEEEFDLILKSFSF